jgi:hypothetical protein
MRAHAQNSSADRSRNAAPLARPASAPAPASNGLAPQVEHPSVTFDFSRVPARAANTPPALQTKLAIGGARDEFEREADSVAERVMGMPEQGQRPAAGFLRAPAATAQTKPAPSGGTSSPLRAPAIVDELLRSSGQPLDTATRAFMEPRFGHDFSNVRVHTDQRAAKAASAIGAQAFASGHSLVFAANRYAPHTHDGRRLVAHELAHVVQQSGSAAAPVQRKIEMKGPPAADGSEHWDMMQKKGEADFLKKHYTNPDDLAKAKAILDDMADAGDELYFDNEDELVSELSKRMKTVKYLRQSQYSNAFGYPDVGYEKDPKLLDPRVNKEARTYWGPVQDRNDDYFFQLSTQGKNEPYQALIRLFKSQVKKADRTLIHCDYLVSVVHMRAFAETIGVAEFEKRVKAGTIPMTLKWNGFDDILTGSPQQKSLQEVRPSSERDLVIGDHVVFWNHRAYDLINENIGEAWRLENAVLEKKLNGVDIFEGHGSGQQTDDTMRAALLKRYNEVTDKALGVIRRANSPNKAESAKAVTEMGDKFPNIHKVSTGWNVQARHQHSRPGSGRFARSNRHVQDEPREAAGGIRKVRKLPASGGIRFSAFSVPFRNFSASKSRHPARGTPQTSSPSRRGFPRWTSSHWCRARRRALPG